MKSIFAFAVGLVACGDVVKNISDAGQENDRNEVKADAAIANPITEFFLIRGGADLCWPDPFATDSATGEIACRMFEVNTGSNVACAADGLSEPEAAIQTAIRSQFALSTSQVVCELPQLPQGDWGGDQCINAKQMGWCYVTGAGVASGCTQQILISTTAQPASGADVMLGCPRAQ